MLSLSSIAITKEEKKKRKEALAIIIIFHLFSTCVLFYATYSLTKSPTSSTPSTYLFIFIGTVLVDFLSILPFRSLLQNCGRKKTLQEKWNPSYFAKLLALAKEKEPNRKCALYRILLEEWPDHSPYTVRLWKYQNKFLDYSEKEFLKIIFRIS